MEILTVFVAAAIGMGVVYFIGLKVTMPTPLDGVVSAIVMTVALFAVAGLLGTRFEFEEPPPPPNPYAGQVDEACALSLSYDASECSRLRQLSLMYEASKSLPKDPIDTLTARVKKIFETVPPPLLVIAYLLGIGGGAYLHHRTST